MVLQEAEADLEEGFLHTVGVNGIVAIDGLLVHWFPNRTALYLLTEHEDTEGFNVLVWLAVGGGAIYRLDDTCSTSYGSLDYLLVGVLLTQNVYVCIDGGCTEPKLAS